jgi:hypothetical protein
LIKAKDPADTQTIVVRILELGCDVLWQEIATDVGCRARLKPPRAWARSRSMRWACRLQRCSRQVMCAESSRSIRRSLGEAWHNNHHAFPTSAAHRLTRSRAISPP